LVFNGHTHEQFVDLFHAIGSDPDNRVVILTGSGDALPLATNWCAFFYPAGAQRLSGSSATIPCLSASRRA
jgi:hypothetical protein